MRNLNPAIWQTLIHLAAQLQSACQGPSTRPGKTLLANWCIAFSVSVTARGCACLASHRREDRRSMRTSPCRPPYAARMSMLLTRQAPASLRAPGSARCLPGQLLSSPSPARNCKHLSWSHPGPCRSSMAVRPGSPVYCQNGQSADRAGSSLTQHCQHWRPPAGPAVDHSMCCQKTQVSEGYPHAVQHVSLDATHRRLPGIAHICK